MGETTQLWPGQREVSGVPANPLYPPGKHIKREERPAVRVLPLVMIRRNGFAGIGHPAPWIDAELRPTVHISI